ncbi:MAG: Ribonuclease, partial [Pseudomonadota bacterium]|jgi:ribonuclease E
MDESKNRREVENRLRDALRQDRARVQFGTISKFGLMEMSRQRLRPALSEGASIPCPRCGGSGHVRDTESSALQILRIIQEESMKENTAAVHAQVPVEVASFLLNEKRPEIAKIELKQRTHVLLIPNKGLETPNYKLERLKHDDPRLDSVQASYKMAEEIEDPTAVTRRSQEPTNRQTPVIKGVLPDMPAPAAEARPARTVDTRSTATASPATGATAPAEKGFFGWLKDFFGGDNKPAIPATDKSGTSAKPGERSDGRTGGRSGSDGRRGGRRGEGRAERGEGRGERTERPERAERGDKPDARGGERPEGRGGRGGRGDRQERPRQEPRLDETVVAETQNPSTDNVDSNAGERPARQTRERGEGRRGRGRRGERAPAGSPDNTTPTEDAQTTQSPTHVEPQTADTAGAEHSVTTSAQEQTHERRERRGRERPGRERQARSNQGGEAPATPQPLEQQAHESTSSSAQPTPAAAPASATPASVIIMPKVVSYDLPLAQLHDVAQSSGLQWVNSNPERVAQIQAAIAAEPRSLHTPRERAAPVVLDEGPLILVETKRDLGQLHMPFEDQ